MIETGEEARLAQQIDRVGALFMRNLECDFLVDPGIFSEEHRAESAAADRRQDLVFPDDLAAEEHVSRSIPCWKLGAWRWGLGGMHAAVVTSIRLAPSLQPRPQDPGSKFGIPSPGPRIPSPQVPNSQPRVP